VGSHDPIIAERNLSENRQRPRRRGARVLGGDHSPYETRSRRTTFASTKEVDISARRVFGRRLTLLTVVALTACGAPDAQEPAASTAIASTTTLLEITTTTAPPSTTSTPPATTSTTAQGPADPRHEFLAGLDSNGWTMYTDSTVGWSIRYPDDWTVIAEEPADLLVLEIPNGRGYLFVLVGQDAVPGETSLDYVVGNVQNAVANGTLEALPEDTLWLDHDFDGVDGPLDIYGGETDWASDLEMQGVQVQIEAGAPTVWYGYYDTYVQPDYGYIMQTVGVEVETLAEVDDVVLSFEPPSTS
jgi:hypothetical protein